MTVSTTQRHFTVMDRLVLAEHRMIVRTGLVIRRSGGIVPPETVSKVLADAGKVRPPEYWA